MHLQKYIFTAILLNIISEISGNVLCQKNEVRNSTEDRCESHCGYETFINFKNQKSNCVCEKGYARNKNKHCIPINDCASECSDNEIFEYRSDINCDCTCKCLPGYYRKNGACVHCAYSKKYMKRCEEFNKDECKCNKCDSHFKECKGECRQNHLNCLDYNVKHCKCYSCAPEFILREGKCYKDCPPNEEFNYCGTACPPTCDEPEPKICTLNCKSGCFCKSGYFRDLKNGKCVDKKHCSCTFNNTQFRLCGPKEPPTCNNPYVSVNDNNCNEDRPGCYCTNGTIRDQYGQCVHPAQCTCKGSNEVYQCRTESEATCMEPKPQPYYDSKCKYGCYCAQGYVRNETGYCVPPVGCKCPPNEVISDSGCKCRPGCERNHDGKCVIMVGEKTCTYPNEKWMDCGPAYPLTCDNMNNRKHLGHCVAGCFCVNKTIRDEKTKRCVHPKDCCKLDGETYIQCDSDDKNCEEGCFCTNGRVRNTNTGKCDKIDSSSGTWSSENYSYEYVSAYSDESE